MPVENRGGGPVIRHFSVPTTGYDHYQLPAPCKHLQIYNEGGFPIRVYFTAADFIADANFKTVAATTGVWEGPVETHKIWFRGVGGTATPVVTIAYVRRG